MLWTRRVAPLALFTLVLGTACTSDDTADSGNQDGASSAPGDGATADETANDDSSELGCAAGIENETSDGTTDPIQLTWGAACNTDQDCIDLIGDPDVICETEAVVYELPGGYCTKPCVLPDATTQWVDDDPTCSADGGVACVGLKGMFERCGLPCTDDQQCNREGYLCRPFPLIGMPDDPNMCLMPECCIDGC